MLRGVERLPLSLDRLEPLLMAAIAQAAIPPYNRICGFVDKGRRDALSISRLIAGGKPLAQQAMNKPIAPPHPLNKAMVFSVL